MTAAEAGPELALESEVKASLAALVAHLLLYEVDAPMLENLCQDDVVEVLDKLDPGCREYLAGRDWVADDFDTLAAEYCRLFVLPGGLPPYASAWLDGGYPVNGPRVAARIKEMMRALGVEEVAGNVPRDHLGFLLALWAQALEAGPGGRGGGRRPGRRAAAALDAGLRRSPAGESRQSSLPGSGLARRPVEPSALSRLF